MTSRVSRLFPGSVSQAIQDIANSSDAVISIVGPTGSGKTNLALAIAKELGTENCSLVSVDSVALYKELNIGSAKPSSQERLGFDWLGLDLVSLNVAVTSSWFVDHLLQDIEQKFKNKKIILVGGSHFYERALAVGRLPGEASDVTYQNSLSEVRSDVLHKKLLSYDLRFGEKILPTDRYRITRYLDLVDRQGQTYESLLETRDTRPWSRVLTLTTQHFDDIDLRTLALKARIENMFQRDWLEEVRALLDQGFDQNCPGLMTIGYRDVVLHLKGTLSYQEMFDRILFSHRQLSKVQRTWVRGLINKTKFSLQE